MNIKRKSKFWTGIFSLVPGCAEMYWGFMKTGISLLTVFAVIFFLAVTFEFGPLVLFMLVIWAYGFFHARNMAHMSDEELQNTGDEYLFRKEMMEELQIFKKDSIRKFVSVILIVLGIYLIGLEGIRIGYRLLPEEVMRVFALIFDYVPRICFGILIIVLGMKLIRGKKQELLEEKNEENQ